MDTADRALLAETVTSALAGSEDADASLAALGWLDMLTAEADTAIEVAFSALGASNAPSTVLDDVVVHGLGLAPRADLAVLLPAFGSSERPSGEPRAEGLTTARVQTARELLVVTPRGAGTAPIEAATVRPVRGIDPDAGLHVVEITLDAVASTEDIDLSTWDTAIARGQRAVAHEIGGASRAMLDLARTHALNRVQFDRPIARFQAVRHRLAEALVAIEALESTLVAAADVPTPVTAQLAKVVAGRTARTVATHCQQVLAGVGFTTDHPFHQYLKRTILLDGLFGSCDDLVLTIGRRLITEQSVPTLIEL